MIQIQACCVAYSEAMNLTLNETRSLVVLTGAGISAESGVPTFRGKGGLWRSYRPEELATPQAFQRAPGLVWEWYGWRRNLIGACQPNAAHRTLVEMESRLEDFCLVTQNVDGLHRLAGSQNIVELHGSIWQMRCTRECRPAWEDRSKSLPDDLPRCPTCGELARPDVVWFGESLPAKALDAAYSAASGCEIMLVIGTLAVVQPAASLPLLALECGAYVVEFNLHPTPLSEIVDEVVRGPAADVVPEWWQSWQSG